MTIRLGFLGAGGIGRYHAESARRAGVEVAAFCDPSEAALAAAVAANPGAAAVSSVDDLLAVPDLPAVVVAVPNHLHKPSAVRLLQAGKDVLLEKPMGLDVAECDEIIAAAAGTPDRLVQLGFVCRCSPATRVVKRWIDEGHFGRIYHARAQWYRRRGIPGLGGWFTTKSRSGGGVLIDLGVHMIDLVMHLTGRPAPRRVSGVCTSTFGTPIERYTFREEMWGGPPRPDGVFDVEDAATALIRFDGGLTLELGTTWAANIPEHALPSGVTIMGEEGGCFFDPWGGRIEIATERHGHLVDEKPQLPDGDCWTAGWRTQHERFRDAVLTRTAPEASMSDGRAVQSVLDAIYRSSDEGCEVAV